MKREHPPLVDDSRRRALRGRVSNPCRTVGPVGGRPELTAIDVTEEERDDASPRTPVASAEKSSV